jgi:hypothetical protein
MTKVHGSMEILRDGVNDNQNLVLNAKKEIYPFCEYFKKF